MYCRNCANEVSAEAIACPKCGVPPMKGKNFCYSCGNATHPDAIICVHCGVALNKSSSIAVGNLKNEALQTAIKQPAFWASVVILIMFFRPWIDFSFITISGWELRDLVRFIKMFDEKFKANAFINLMYFLPILSILLITSYFVRNEYLTKRIRTWKILTGIYPWLFFISLLFAGVKHPTDWMAYGLYLTLAAAAYLLYDGIFLSKKRDSLNIIEPTQVPLQNYIPQQKTDTVTPEPVNRQNTETIDTSIDYPAPTTNKSKYIIVGLIVIVLVLVLVLLFQREKTSNAATDQPSVTNEQTLNQSQQTENLPTSTDSNELPKDYNPEADLTTSTTPNTEPPPTTAEQELKGNYTGKDGGMELFFRGDGTASWDAAFGNLSILLDVKDKGDTVYLTCTGIDVNPNNAPDNLASLTPKEGSLFAKLYRIPNASYLGAIYMKQKFVKVARENQAGKFPDKLYKQE